MTMKRAAKAGAAKAKRKLTLKKETLRDLSAREKQADQIKGATGNRCFTGFTGHP